MPSRIRLWRSGFLYPPIWGILSLQFQAPYIEMAWPCFANVPAVFNVIHTMFDFYMLNVFTFFTDTFYGLLMNCHLFSISNVCFICFIPFPPVSQASHYSDVIMAVMGSQITSFTIVYSTVYSGTDKKTSKLPVTGLCAWNSPVTGEFPAQMASNAENVTIWLRHHVLLWFQLTSSFIVTADWRRLFQHIQACAKWPPICRRHFQIGFSWQTMFVFPFNFHWVLFQGSSWQ